MPLPRRQLLIAGALLPLAAHAEGGNPPPPSPPAPPAGIVLPLTGGQALLGDECLRGIQLAADAINAAGGIAGQTLALYPADAGGDSGQAVKSLIAANRAGFLLGTGSSALSYAGSAAAELAQIPYIELNAAADGITTRGFKFLLRTCETTAMIANILTTAIAARYPGKTIGLLFNTGATAGAIAAALLSQWQSQKITPLLSTGYPEDSADLRDPVGRLSRAGPAILVHAAGPDDVLTAFQAMQDIGWRPTAIFGAGDGYLLRETAYALGNPFDGTYAAGAPCYPPRAGYISTAYQSRFGVAPRSPESLTAFVGAKLVFDTLNNVKGDPTKLLAALRATDIPTGTLANGFGASFDKTGQNTRSLATLQVWQNEMLAPVG